MGRPCTCSSSAPPTSFPFQIFACFSWFVSDLFVLSLSFTLSAYHHQPSHLAPKFSVSSVLRTCRLFFQRAAGADYTSASSALNWQRFKAHRPRPLDVIDQTEPRANGDDICKRRVCSRRFLVAHLRPEYTTFKENQIKALTQTKKKKAPIFFFLAWPSLQTSPDVASVKKKKKETHNAAVRGGVPRRGTCQMCLSQPIPRPFVTDVLTADWLPSLSDGHRIGTFCQIKKQKQKKINAPHLHIAKTAKKRK